ncbi:hypothetical protein [Verrucomicrobium spinosum]|uniref:hypothetical protein n=1 Tax=Verrucomicrobium spinosum TaxID=2736 RepID=UPI0012E23A9C|nr:hypothetical protein [Verrucomicrobium spinosum]
MELRHRRASLDEEAAPAGREALVRLHHDAGKSGCWWIRMIGLVHPGGGGIGWANGWFRHWAHPGARAAAHGDS